MSIGSNENASAMAILAGMPADRAERAAEQAMRLHAAVRSHAGLDPGWEEISQGLRDFYVRLATSTDARRAEFFRT